MIDKQLIDKNPDTNHYWKGMKLIGVGYLIMGLMLFYYTFFNSIVFAYFDISMRHYGSPLLMFHLLASSIAVLGLWKCIKEYKMQKEKVLYLTLPILANLLLHGSAVPSFITFFNR